MPRLFAPQAPLWRNLETGDWEPKKGIDLTPAKRFGELVFIWPPGSLISSLPNVSAEAIGVARTYDDGEDFVINIGSPSLIGVLCWAIGNVGKELRVLEWDRKINDYVPVFVKQKGKHER